MSNSQIDMTVDLTDKSVEQLATPSLRETIDLNFSSRGDSVSANLTALIMNSSGTTVLAQKVGLIDWQTSGAQAAALNLNTDELIAEFANRSLSSIRSFRLYLLDTTQQDWIVNSTIRIKNAPSTDGIISPSIAGTEFLESEPSPESNWKLVNGKICFWDITDEGYRAPWFNNGAPYGGPIETE